jgi:hypothetical protein
VIEYLEQVYITSDQSTQQQLERENQAKNYLLDALATVVQNINTVAGNHHSIGYNVTMLQCDLHVIFIFISRKSRGVSCVAG